MAKKKTETVAAEEPMKVDAAGVVEPVAVAAAVTAEPAAAEAGPEKGKEEDVLKLVYIGPSIPRSGLRHAQVLEGTKEQIDKFLSALLERYPEIPHMLVAPDKLSDALKKTQQKGNILHKYYQDMAAKAKARRK